MKQFKIWLKTDQSECVNISNTFEINCCDCLLCKDVTLLRGQQQCRIFCSLPEKTKSSQLLFRLRIYFHSY